MNVVVRTWQNDGALADEMTKQAQPVEGIIGGVPGFVSYYATRSGDTLTSVTVCNDKAGAEESTKRAGKWVKANVKDASLGAPQVIQGATFVQV